MNYDKTRKCPICGKEYYIPDVEVWVYKRHRSHTGDIYFCSYKCTRKYDALHTPKANRIKAAIRAGISDEELTRCFGLTKAQISYYRVRTE